MKKYGKNLLFISRIVLFCIGFVLGLVAMIGILNAYKGTVSNVYRIVYCAFTGLFVGIVLMLSCRSVLWLLFTVGEGIKNLFRGKKRMDVLGVFIGLALGGLLTYLFDFLISLGTDILSLRVILDVVFAISAVGLGVFVSLRALRGQSKPERKNDFVGGYLLTSDALMCDGIDRFCRDWLLCPVAVLDVSVAKLKSLDAYSSLLNCGAAYTVSVGAGNEREEAEKYALENDLRIITANAGDFINCEVPVLGFCDIRGVTIDENNKRV